MDHSQSFTDASRDAVSSLSDEDLAAAFDENRPRLTQMVRIRMDQRLQGRVDISDVLQDAFVECLKRLPEYRQKPAMPLFLWIRFLTGQKLIDLQRMHLGTKMRAVSQEARAPADYQLEASSLYLADQLFDHLTSPSQAAVRAETQQRIQQALDAMEPIDREILAMRHFEMLTNEETSQVLGLTKTAASNRYIRALRRLKAILDVSGER